MHIIDNLITTTYLLRAYNNRGNAYDGRGKHDLAFEDYSRAIESNPNDADAYFYRGFTYELKRDFGEGY